MDRREVELLKEYLDEQYYKYCRSSFIEDDPVQVPHLFSSKQNIEIAGFIAASFAWGLRPTIIRKAKEFLSIMDNAPFDFLTGFNESDLSQFDRFKHRTFNGEDAKNFIRALSKIYKAHLSLDDYFISVGVDDPVKGCRALRGFFTNDSDISSRTLRHVANVDAGSAAKRINMFFRWMVRTSKEGVDFGMWSSIHASKLLIPLDMHVGNVARELGLLTRRQNDLRAVLELTEQLQQMDADDPVKYDFSLFCLGAYKVSNRSIQM